MTGSVHPQDFVSDQNFPGQMTIWSNAAIHERGVMLGTYSNSPGEAVQLRDRYVICQIGAHPARAERRIGGRSVAFIKNPGSLTLIPKGFSPDVRLLTLSKMVICHLNQSVISELVEELDRQPSSPLDFKSGISDPAIAGILALIKQELQTGSQPGILYVETLVHALAIKLVHLDCVPERIGSSTTSSLPPNRLKRIKELIETELEKDLSLKVLASESGYSRAHFLRMFRVSTGITPHRYVLERRIDRAQRLLKEKRASLADIAAACGFSSQTHMADIFRRNLNTTPGEYRREI